MTVEPLVYVVDDDAAARDSVLALAKSQQVAAVAFDSAEAFLQAYNPSVPGCLVLDVRMPGMDGLELQRRLRALCQDLPVIVITAFADVPLAVEAFRQGALILLEKPCQNQDLWARIREGLALSRSRWELRARQRLMEDRMAQLTSGERAVLDLLLSGQTNKAIAARLDCGLRTVELRRANLLKRFDCTSLAQLAHELVVARLPDHPQTPEFA